MTEIEVEEVLGYLDGPCWARDRALFLLGARAGFRISRVLSLRLGAAVRAGQAVAQVRVPWRHIKGARDGGTLLLRAAARASLASWIDDLRCDGYMTADSFIFQSRCGSNQVIGRTQVWRIPKRAVEQAVLTGNLRPHLMRKTFADRIYDRVGRDLVKTAQVHAHRWISSTTSYRSLRESEIDEAILSI